jgi:hypothetical protein
VSDLSRLLGDVYGASSEDAAADDPPAPPVEAAEPTPSRPAAPGWADDDVLDEAFAEWVPGPTADADDEERDILADVEPVESVAEPVDIDAWLGPEPMQDLDDIDARAEAPDVDATAGYNAFDDEFVPATEPGTDPGTEVGAQPAMADDGAWRRESDDLLPRGRRTRRLSLSLRR